MMQFASHSQMANLQKMMGFASWRRRVGCTTPQTMRAVSLAVRLPLLPIGAAMPAP